jgi:hypothetical protein
MLAAGTGRAATRGDGEVIELDCGITMYPARSEGGRWRAASYENDERQQCEAVTEEKLAAKLEKVRAQVAGACWGVEECFQAGKNEAALDHYQVRLYKAWYRHVTLSMLALAWLAVTRAQLVGLPQPLPATTQARSLNYAAWDQNRDDWGSGSSRFPGRCVTSWWRPSSPGLRPRRRGCSPTTNWTPSRCRAPATGRW